MRLGFEKLGLSHQPTTSSQRMNIHTNARLTCGPDEHPKACAREVEGMKKFSALNFLVLPIPWIFIEST